MKQKTLFSMTALLAASLLAAYAEPKDDIINAAKKLGEQANYSWTATVTVNNDSQFRPGPTDGKTEKDGYTHVTMTFFDNPVDFVLKGDKVAFTNQDGDWQTVEEAENDAGGQGGGFMARFARNIQTAAAQAEELASLSSDLKKEGDVYSGDLTEAGVKTYLSFRRDPNDENISDAKASVKFWLNDGKLTKYEFTVKGTVDFNGNEFENDRTTTVEIKDVGSTTVEPPDEAKKKLS